MQRKSVSPIRLIWRHAGLCLFAAAATALPAMVWAQPAGQAGAWVRSFAAPPTYLPVAAETRLDHQTVRMPVRLTAAGDRLRLEFSNAHGRASVTLSAVSVRVTDKIGTHTLPVLFDGRPDITMAVGAPVMSDPVAAHVSARQIIEVSVYVDGVANASTIHRDPENLAMISTSGDFARSDAFPVAGQSPMRPFLSAIDVHTAKPSRTIVALGDSISDWDCPYSDKAPCQWEDTLFQRLAAAGKSYAIANVAISADRILLDGPGGNAPWSALSAQARFDRDVLSVPNVSHLLFMMGINDIGMSGNPDVVSADALIVGMKQLIKRAHAHGIKVYAAEILPFKGAGYSSPEKEAVRLKVNAWIRDSGAFDGYLGFLEAVADPKDMTRLKPEFNKGDNLHPNAAGQRAMGNAIDLKLFP